MKIIKQEATCLVIQDKPWVFWISGAFFLCLAPLFFKAELPIFALNLCVVAILCIFLPSVRTYTFDKKTQQFSLVKKNIFRNKEKTIPFENIVDVEIYSPNKRLYFFNLLLTEEKRLTLADASSRNNSFEALAEIIRSYLRK